MFEGLISILKMIGIIVVVAILIIAVVVMRENNKLNKDLEKEEGEIKRGKEPNLQVNSFQRRYILWDESYSGEAVGESHYQSNLLSISGAKEEQSKLIDTIAELRHEPNNEFDPNAQAVYIDGLQVGYLSQREAHALIREKEKLHLGPHTIILVKSRIIGGWKNTRNEGSFGVVLDTPPLKDIPKVISDISFDDSNQKRAKNIPLNREQRRFFDYMGIKRDDSVNSLNADKKIADKKIEIRSSEDREFKEKLITYQKRERVILDLLDDWRDRDNGVISLYDEIKMPSELQILKTLEALESNEISWDEIKSNNEMFYNKLLEKYPKLEK